MSDEINILCGFDDAYAPHFATMIASLLAASRNPQKIKFHLISNLLGPAIRARLDQVVAAHGIAAIQWLETDLSPFADAPLSLHFTRATYARITAFNVLPAPRVLYLDVDLLCLADLAELHDTNLHGNIVAAVLDPNTTFGVDQHKASLGIPIDALTFNAGVLTVDLDRWRQGRLTEVCLDFLKEKRSAIWWVDQDVLNGVLAEKWLKLDSAWNVQSHFWKPNLREYLAQKMPGELNVIQAPKIVHFNDPQKPWHFGYRHPYREAYYQHLSRSGWPHGVYVATVNGIRDQFVKFA